MPNEKNKGIGLPHAILGRRKWTNTNGRPVTLTNSGILNQRSKFEDLRENLMWSVGMETKENCRSKKTVEHLHGGVSRSPRIQQTIEPLHFLVIIGCE